MVLERDFKLSTDQVVKPEVRVKLSSS